MTTSRAERAAAYLRDINQGHGKDPGEGIGTARMEEVLAGSALESTDGSEVLREPIRIETVYAGLEAVEAGREPTRLEAAGLEAIIIPDKRPAMPLQGGTYQATHPLWTHLEDPTTKARLVKRARSVGRVEAPGSGLPYGGTAFVVGPGLLMTNRHVATIFTAGLGMRELDFRTGITSGFNTAFAPDEARTLTLRVRGVAMVHPYWDMALLEVEGLAADMVPLMLEARDIAGFEKKEVAVIGYPAFDPRNDADVQRSVFTAGSGIKQLQPGLLRERGNTESFKKIVSAATHDCSTLGGNSGSAVIHIASGNVLALHFGGLYLARNYGVPASELALDGRVVDAGVKFDPTARPDKAPSWTGYWTDADRDEAPAPTPTQAASAVPQRPAAGMTRSIETEPVREFMIPLHITVRLGEAVTVMRAEVPAPAEIETLAEPVHDTDYTTRDGYQEMFLGVRAPMPSPASPGVIARTKTGASRLDYRHFSIMMHEKRRLALFVASNVTAERALKRPDAAQSYTRRDLTGLCKNDQEKWFVDPRLNDEFQLPDLFYTRDDGAFDKGHIARRDDVAWGESHAELKQANGDTYHVTNCSPQVAAYNRSANGVDNWGDLENVVLAQASSERLCLFAGPVLAEGDAWFLGRLGGGQRVRVQIPSRFWKVVVALVESGLASFGFVLEQDLSAMPQEEFVAPDEFKRFMMPLSEIAAMTGVVFDPAVVEADQFELRGPEVARQASVGMRERRR